MLWLLFKPKWDGTGWEWEKKKIFSFWSIPTRHGIGNSKNIAKKCQKLKKTLLWLNFDTERDGTGWDWEKKKILSFRSIHSWPVIGISKKIKKHEYDFFSSQNGTGEAQIVRKKKFSFLSIPNRLGIGNSRKIAKKIQKIQKYQFGFISRKNGTGEAENVRKKKNSHSDPF